MKLMGLPLEHLDQFLAMKDGIIRPPGHSMEDQEPVRRKTAQDIYEYFQTVIDERRGAPARPDLLGRIMDAELDGGPLPAAGAVAPEVAEPDNFYEEP